MGNRRCTITLVVVALVGAAMLAAAIWSVFDGRATGYLQSWWSFDAAPTPPQLATVKFAEECARDVLSVKTTSAKDYASKFGYRDCEYAEEICEANHLEFKDACKEYCKIYDGILKTTGPVATRSCDVHKNAGLLDSGDNFEVTASREDEGDWYKAAIKISNGGKLCTGVLIAKNLALTGAHCVEKSVAIRGAKVTNNKNGVPSNGAAIEVRDAVTLRRENPNGLDLAMIELNSSFDEASIAKLAKQDFPDPKNVRVVGYGWNENQEKGRRRYGTIAIASWTCPAKDAAAFGCQTGKEFVAIGLQKNGVPTDACTGDSGGPVFAPADPIQDDNKFRKALQDPEKYRIVGITNQSTTNAKRTIDVPGDKIVCGDGTSYVNVTTRETRNWIIDTAKNKFGVTIQ